MKPTSNSTTLLSGHEKLMIARSIMILHIVLKPLCCVINSLLKSVEFTYAADDDNNKTIYRSGDNTVGDSTVPRTGATIMTISSAHLPQRHFQLHFS